MPLPELQITIWDVGHGLSVWIKTPSGHHHWVDTGYLPGFSPAKHVYDNYGVRTIDYLTISHADKDHFDDLDNFITCFGAPRVFKRNKTVPDREKYGFLGAAYQNALFVLDSTHTHPVELSRDPRNPLLNGGVNIFQCMLNWDQASNINDSSVVSFYEFGGWLFVLPGDIGPSAWDKLWENHGIQMRAAIDAASVKILIAPHHGRESGYSKAMIDAINPHAIIVSDAYGREPTDYHFRTEGQGLEHNFITGELRRIPYLQRLLERTPQKSTLLSLLSPSRDIKYLSMKSNGRLQFTIGQTGSCKLHIAQE